MARDLHKKGGCQTHHRHGNSATERLRRQTGEEMRAILILVHSDRRHRIDTFPLVIGRGDDADLHVPDPLVSRRHCRIDAVKGTLLLEDLGSRNGTCVNGCLVESSPLLPGDHVGLGSHVFRVVYERISLDEPPRTVYRGTDESSRHCESTFR